MSQVVAKLLSEVANRAPVSAFPKKIMRVRDRNVDFSIGKVGVLKRVMGNRFIKHNYTHVQLRGFVHQVNVSRGFFDAKIIWIE